MIERPFILFIFTTLISLSLAGRIRPYGRTPILLSVNNGGKTSDYTFTFLLDTDT